MTHAAPVEWRFGLPAALLLVFVLFTATVLHGAFESVDRAIVLALQAYAGPLPDLIGSLLSFLGAAEIELPLAAIGAFWLWRRGNRPAALALALLLPLALIAAGLKATLDHPGVDAAALHLQARELLPGFPSSDLKLRGSYPSGHMARASYLGGLALFALARTARPLPRALGAVSVVLVLLLLAVTRPFLGEHWPTDVVGGFLLAAI